MADLCRKNLHPAKMTTIRAQISARFCFWAQTNCLNIGATTIRSTFWATPTSSAMRKRLRSLPPIRIVMGLYPIEPFPCDQAR
jgi:hypothetical protein